MSYIDLDGLEEKKVEETNTTNVSSESQSNTPKPTNNPPKIDLSKANWYNQIVSLFKWTKDNRNTLPSTIPINNVIDFTKFPNKNFSLGSSFFGDQYESEEKAGMPEVIIQTTNLKMNIVKEVYIINRSSLIIDAKYPKNNNGTVENGYFKLSGKREGIITVMIPTINPVTKSPQMKGIQINFDVSDEKQYKMFKELVIYLDGINVYKNYKYLKLSNQ